MTKMHMEDVHPVVQKALDAMRAHDRAAWLNLFTADAVLTDDGSPHDLIPWSDRELFGAQKGFLASVNRTENDGLTLYGNFHSDRWGDFNTYFRFTLRGDKIARLDVGQA